MTTSDKTPYGARIWVGGEELTPELIQRHILIDQLESGLHGDLVPLKHRMDTITAQIDPDTEVGKRVEEALRAAHKNRVNAALSRGSVLSEWWWAIRPQLEQTAARHLFYLTNIEGEKARAKRLEDTRRLTLGGRRQGKSHAVRLHNALVQAQRADETGTYTARLSGPVE